VKAFPALAVTVSRRDRAAHGVQRRSGQHRGQQHHDKRRYLHGTAVSGRYVYYERPAGHGFYLKRVTVPAACR